MSSGNLRSPLYIPGSQHQNSPTQGSEGNSSPLHIQQCSMVMQSRLSQDDFKLLERDNIEVHAFTVTPDANGERFDGHAM